MATRRRTVIDLSSQPGLDFEAEVTDPEFIEPHYQRQLLIPRLLAMLTDLGVVLVLYGLFVVATMTEMAGPLEFNRTVIGIYLAAYLVLVLAYLSLFMISTSRTLGMSLQRLVVVNEHGRHLNPPEALLRAFGYLISLAPVMFGLAWAFIDPEHLTWADKVSRTFVKRA